MIRDREALESARQTQTPCRCGHAPNEHRDLDTACTLCLFCDRFMEQLDPQDIPEGATTVASLTRPDPNLRSTR